MEHNDNDIIRPFLDVLIWLLKIGVSDPFLLQQITDNATQETAQYFKVPFSEIKNLFSKTKFTYTDEELPKVIFYYGYLRKIRDSRQ
jgi:hypothetical protein